MRRFGCTSRAHRIAAVAQCKMEALSVEELLSVFKREGIDLEVIDSLAGT